MKNLLFSLLRYALWEGDSVDKEEVQNALPQIFTMAKKHDLGQTVAFAAEKLGISDKALTREKDLAIFRVERIKYAAEQVGDLLSAAEIPHIFLKGAHVRELYPEEWMRPSCDVDVYVDADRVDAATHALVMAGYTQGRRHIYDVLFTSPEGSTVELHFALMTEGYQKKASELLKNVWSYTEEDGCHRYRMNGEMSYFYHISHMAKHVQTGGCGIRPFMDMKLLADKCDRAKAEALLSEGGLLTFEKAAERLADAWFFNGRHDDVTEVLEEYVLSGAVYGTKHNAAASQGSRMRYLASRAFMPYAELKQKYPSLDGKPYLMPIYTLRRWFGALKKKKVASTFNELKASGSASETEMQKYGALFKKLEI